MKFPRQHLYRKERMFRVQIILVEVVDALTVYRSTAEFSHFEWGYVAGNFRPSFAQMFH